MCVHSIEIAVILTPLGPGVGLVTIAGCVGTGGGGMSLLSLGRKR